MNISKNIIKFFEIRKIFLYDIIIIIHILKSLSKGNKNEIYMSESSYINIKVKGTGINRIFYGRYQERDCALFVDPDEVYINGINQSYISSQYNFTESENDVKLVWYNKINNTVCMFYLCENITYVDLSHFDSSEVTYIGAMFNGCKSLKEINFTNFNTSQVTRMQYMFVNCISLVSLNLSMFDTSNLYSIEHSFYNCQSLTSIDLSNFDTSKIKWIWKTFYGCSNLEYINLKKATQNNDLSYGDIFTGIPENIVVCIDEEKNSILSNLILQKKCSVINCSDDWKSMKKKIGNDTAEDGCSLNCNDNNNYIYEYKSKCYDNCPNGYFIDEKNIPKCLCDLEKCLLCADIEPAKNLCISCNYSYYPKENDITNIGPYINCYKDPDGYYLDKSNSNNYIYKLCYESCLNCLTKGDHINHYCLRCNKDYVFSIAYNNYLNCYKNCTYYYYFDENNNYYCTNDSSCPLEYNKLIIDKRECIKQCSSNTIYKYEFRNKCYELCPKDSELSLIKDLFCEALCSEEKPFVIIETQECVDFCDINYMKNDLCKLKYEFDADIENDNNKEEKNENKEIKAQDKFLENIEKGFTSDNYDTTNLDKGEDDIIENNKITITLTTTDNQKNNKNSNVTIINLGDCEILLRKEYNLSKNETLYIKKIDIKQEGMKIPKVEYEVYCKLNKSNLVKLNLTICKNVKIDLYVPIIINENIDKLNSSSGYYNDICYTTTSESGTDIPLKDRKKEFINKNKTVCQDNCDFADYDYNINKAICKCDVKESLSSFANMIIDKEKLFKSFTDINNIANINLLICYKVLFNSKGISSNIGFYVNIFIIILHIICIIIFYSRQINIIKEKINDIIFGINNWNLVKIERKLNRLKKQEKEKKLKEMKEKKIKIKQNQIKKRLNFKREKISNNKIKPEVKNNKKKILSSPLEFFYLQNKKELRNKETNLNSPMKRKKKQNQKNIIINNYIYNNNNNIKINNMKTSSYVNQGRSSFINLNNTIKRNKKILERIKRIMAFNENEMNQLPYKLAIIYDKRTFCEYYISLLKTKHILIFSFCYSNDYNSKIIKLDLFFFSFIIYYTVNALFFNDETMHKIYEDKGKFQFLYQLPQIIYSSIISSVLNTLLKLFALSEENIIELKNNKTKKKLNERKKNLENKFNIKFISFFIFSTIILLFCWYYLAMFCAIYINTQIHLLSDTLISFGISLIYPFGIYLLPGFFRIPALSNSKNKRNCLYEFSKFIQMI